MQKEPLGLKSTNSSPSPAATTRSNKNNNKKQSNKGLCPFACPTCQSLGGELVRSKYEIANILSPVSDSIYLSPFEELKGGKIFVSLDEIQNTEKYEFWKRFGFSGGGSNEDV